ncbi:MAG TPA: hypothetical protein VFB62_17325 [Polyangiaceae bacterium]|jgi:hypothetical protein|nr:hypothetical protein [Polyangiaceae bacterium]
MPKRRQLLLGLTGLAGCATVVEPKAPAQPRDALEVAYDIVRTRLPDSAGRVWALFHVHAAHGTGIAYACRAIYGTGYLLDALGIEPEELERVFTLSTDATSYSSTLEAVHIFEHRLSPERAEAAFDAAVETLSNGGRIEGLGFSAAEVMVGTAERLLAAPTPRIIASLPSGEVVGAIQLVGTGGLPRRREREAMVFGVTNPQNGALGFSVPATISRADAVITLNGAADARVLFTAVSTDPQQAEIDAQWITDHVNDALTIDLEIAELRVLGPYLFRAEKNRVVSELAVSRDEAEWVVAMARTFMPGG